MRRAFAVIAVSCVLGLSVQFATAGLAQSKGGDEAAVREVVANYVAARERGDAAAVAAVFTEHADQLTSSGEWRRGRDELVRGTLASSKTNSGARTITIRDRAVSCGGCGDRRRRVCDRGDVVGAGQEHVDVVRHDPQRRPVAHRRHPQHAARVAGTLTADAG